uniref:Two-component response regulator ARR8 n=1 Tax=Anthurium amnicola TaxID=1678845 RepID=A0A1D1YDI7_9ARAE
MSRLCLEEGAEEFFLKPVKLSDMEKLIPHIMKRRSTEQPKEEQQLKHSQQPQQTQQNDHNNLLVTAMATDSSINSSNSSNKRKAMDESLSPERPRPRCRVTA